MSGYARTSGGGYSNGYVSGGTGFTNTKSLLLDGVDEYINIDSVQSALSTTTAGAWSIWIKPVDATPTSLEYVIDFGDTNAATDIALRIATTGELNAYSRINNIFGWELKTDNPVFSDNTWTHIGLDQNGTSPVLYINGVAVAQTLLISLDTTQWFNDIAGLDNGFISGRSVNLGGFTLPFNGNVDEATFYNTTLGASAFADIYNGGCPKDESGRSGLIGYYRMGDGAGDNWNSGVASEWQFIDQSGNSNNVFTTNCEEADVETDTPC